MLLIISTTNFLGGGGGGGKTWLEGANALIHVDFFLNKTFVLSSV